MDKDKTEMTEQLLRNSISAIIAGIEIHNKPIFSYRYEVCVLLIINSWELLLKAYINKHLPDVNLIIEDGRTKPFSECLACVASNIGNEFAITKESLGILYEYRNKIAHFYFEDIEIVVFSVLQPTIKLYSAFITEYFGLDLSKEVNFMLLPLGFVKPISPIDFLTNNSASSNTPSPVISFIEQIIESSKRLSELNIEGSILIDYRMHIKNENRIKNADVIAGISSRPEIENYIVLNNMIEDFTISSNPQAKEVRLAEEDMKKLYPYDFNKVVGVCKTIFSNFLQNNLFYSIINATKDNPKFHYVKFLERDNPKTPKKHYYSIFVLDELSKYYTLKEGIDLEEVKKAQ